MDDGAACATTVEAAGGLPLAIAGGTRVYAILGDPVEQVGSPRVFNTLFRERGVAAVLVPLRVPAGGLATAIAGLRQMRNIDGLIITVPHKLAVLPLLDRVENAGRRVGAVNAIRRGTDGELIGDNFDGIGCVRALEERGHDLQGRRALVVGAGGAGRAIAHAFADAGVAALRLADLDAGRAENLASGLVGAHPGLDVTVGPAEPENCSLVVNATSLGMTRSDPYPVDPARLAPGTVVVDVILKPRRSPLLEAAAARGLATQPGHLMLEGQAMAIARFFGIVS